MPDQITNEHGEHNCAALENDAVDQHMEGARDNFLAVLMVEWFNRLGTDCFAVLSKATNVAQKFQAAGFHGASFKVANNRATITYSLPVPNQPGRCVAHTIEINSSEFLSRVTSASLLSPSPVGGARGARVREVKGAPPSLRNA